MRKEDLKILTINLDYNLARDESDLGDVKQRNIEYGEQVQKIFSITHTPRKRGFSHKRLSEKLEVFPTLSRHPIFFIPDALKIARGIFLDNHIDLVLTQDPFITGLVGYILKLRYGCAYLIHFHGDFFANKYWRREKWYNFLLLFLAKFLIRKADGIRVVSSGIKDKLVKNKVAARKIRVIPTPVDLQKMRLFDLNEVRRIKRECGHRKIVFNIGRRDNSKDFATLFKTIEKVYANCRKLAFIQIGADFYLPEKIRSDGNLILISKGRTNYDELTNYFHAADVYVSSSCHESLGKVLIESMAAGTPVVATRTTGSQDIVQDNKTGFLTAIGDSDALSKKVLLLINNPEKAREIKENAKRMVKEKFDRKRLVKKTVDFWRDLAKKSDGLRKPAGRFKNLLIITRRVDKDDGQTGFFYLWLKKFAQNVERVKVICLEKGNTKGLPENVEVYSLGKENGKDRWREFVRFQKGALKFLPRVGGVFCHQNPEYTILIAPWAKLLRKRIVSFYGHKHVDWRIRLMAKLADRIVTSSKFGFQIKTPKRLVIGQGIDTDRFRPGRSGQIKQNDVFRIISVGRFSPIKDYETLVEAIAILNSEQETKKRIRVDLIYRQPETKKEKSYFAKIQTLVRKRKLKDIFNFLGTIPNEKIVEHYQKSDASINLCPTGAPDKVVLEAMACALPTLVCNEAFADEMGDYRALLLFEEKNAQDLARKIFWLMSTEKGKLRKVGMFLRGRVMESHNLDNLVERIIGCFRGR